MHSPAQRMYRELEYIEPGVVDEYGDYKRLSYLSYFDSELCSWPGCPFPEDMKDVAPARTAVSDLSPVPTRLRLLAGSRTGLTARVVSLTQPIAALPLIRQWEGRGTSLTLSQTSFVRA